MQTNILAALLLASIGSLLFIQVYNRLLLHMVHGKLKSFICYTAMVVFPTIPMIFGFFVGRKAINVWTLLLIAGLIFFELTLRVRRRLLRRSKPTEKILIPGITPNHHIFRNTTEELVMRTFPLHMDDWNGPSVRIIHLTDFHIDKFKTLDFVTSIVDAVNKQKPDIVVLTGDYTDSLKQLPALEELIKGINAPLGVFGCLGNHDYWADPTKIKTSLEKVGVIFPPDNGHVLKLTETACLRFFNSDYPYIDQWTFNPLPTTRETCLNLVLSHTPDYYQRLADSGADLIFSGHLHGGQWRLPLIGSVIAPSIRDRLFDMGHFSLQNTHVFVSAGIGNVWFPYRLNCPAEILCLELSGCQNRSGSFFETCSSSQVQKELPEVLRTAR